MFKKIILIAVLPILAFSACKSSYSVENISAALVVVDSTIVADSSITAYIKPYADTLSQRMNEIIAHSAQFVDRSQSEIIAYWFSDAMKKVFEKNYLQNYPNFKTIDIALFNAGGMRTVIPQGDVKLSFVYEFMPFDNRFTLVKLKGDAMLEMLNFLSSSQVKHPISGLVIRSLDGKLISAEINGKPFSVDSTYTILSSDFCFFGGDKMNFFKNNQKYQLTELLIREALLESLVQNPKIVTPKDKRYVEFK